MTFYQELQLNQAGSKNLLKKSETVPISDCIPIITSYICHIIVSYNYKFIVPINYPICRYWLLWFFGLICWWNNRFIRNNRFIFLTGHKHAKAQYDTKQFDFHDFTFNFYSFDIKYQIILCVISYKFK